MRIVRVIFIVVAVFGERSEGLHSRDNVREESEGGLRGDVAQDLKVCTLFHCFPESVPVGSGFGLDPHGAGIQKVQGRGKRYKKV
jgi:hypothetical protein